MAEITNAQTAGLRGNTPAFEYITAKSPVVSGVGATRTINDSESGSVFLMDRYAGTKFTLPTGVPGQQLTFLTNVTSNTYSIVTNIGTSTPVIIGALPIFAEGITGSMFVAAGGSALVRIVMNGTTTGGVQGSKIVLTNLSSGTWFVSGTLMGSGTLATPFSALSA